MPRLMALSCHVRRNKNCQKKHEESTKIDSTKGKRFKLYRRLKLFEPLGNFTLTFTQSKLSNLVCVRRRYSDLLSSALIASEENNGNFSDIHIKVYGCVVAQCLKVT